MKKLTQFRSDHSITISRLGRTVAALVLTLFISFTADAQPGSPIEGTIRTSDGKPVEGVSLTITQLNRTAASNERGEFRFNRIPAGTYTIAAKIIGYQTIEQSVRVSSGIAGIVNFTLMETQKQLQEIGVSVDRLNQFAEKKSDYVARMPLENLENPQVYSAVGKALIEDQVIVDFKESLRNVAGVSPNNNPAGGTGGTIRGFTATTTVRNGLAVQSYQSDPVNMERIEVIKGPSGTLFGTSIASFGGLVNQVTKKPYDTFGGEVGMTLGKYELSRITADINTPLNEDKTALLRINAAAHRENSFQNYGHKRMYTFAPSLSYKVDDKLSFLFQAELSKTTRSTVAYWLNTQLTTYKSLREIPLPFEISLTGSNIDAELRASNFYTEAVYNISDKWTSTTNVAYGENQIDHSNQIYPTFTATNKFDRTISNYGPRIFTSLNAQQNFNGDFSLFGLRNRVVTGVNFYTFRSFLRFTAVGTYDQIDLGTSVNIPGINLEKVNNIVAAKAQTNTENNQGSYSFYASDVLNVTERLAAMLSLRIDRFENAAAVANGIKAATGSYNQTSYSPKFGLTYQIVKNKVSLFGNYMNGFQNVGPVTQPTGVVDVFKPRQANQYEGGLKMEVFGNKLNATLSYYNIRISNDTRLQGNITVQDATSRSKGLEFEVIANPVSGLNIITGYATNSYRLIKATSNAGKRQAQTPTDYFNFWASYKFSAPDLKGIGLGFGGNYVGKCYFDAVNVIAIPEYTVLNGSVFYDQPKFRVTIKANNLGNKEYWTNYGIPEMKRQYLGSISFKF